MNTSSRRNTTRTCTTEKKNEDSETFIRALHELAEHCDFSNKNDQGTNCGWT